MTASLKPDTKPEKRPKSALAFLRQRRRRNRLGQSDWEDIAYRVEMVVLPFAALGYLAWYSVSQNPVTSTPPPTWIGWALSGVFAIYGILRLLNAVGLGPVRLVPAEAELMASAPLPVRGLIVRHLVVAATKEFAGATLVAMAWGVQAYLSFGSSFALVFPLTVAGLVPYVLTVVGASWLVENSPGLQRRLKNALPNVAWIPIPIVLLSPLLIGLLSGIDASQASRWWGPWAWAADPSVQALHGRVELIGMWLVLGVGAIVWTFAVWTAGRPAYVAIELRSRLAELRSATRMFQDAIGLHSVRRQLWAADRVRTGGLFLTRRPKPGESALMWKSARHLLREGTASWALPVAALMATAVAVVHAPPVVALGIGLVLVYMPASRLLSPLLADLEADAIASQVPVDARRRVAYAMSTPVILLVVSAVLGVASLWLFTEVPALLGLVGILALPLLAIIALGCAAFGAMPSKLDLTVALPAEFWVLARYQGAMLWITCVVIAVGPNLLQPLPAWTFIALVVEIPIVWALVQNRYGHVLTT